MGNYTLKTIGNHNDRMTVIKEVEDGYVVRITRDKDGYTDVTTSYIHRALFESCLRTGYIVKIDDASDKLAVNA
ncbi:MAG: hypothetical protein II563_02620 [Treponema sp.]|nr:hypothetical protein [Treponema sp.]MBQ2551727.1 hypothetical protein [Treponema sp.]MBQ4236541.1 hypothetical protein [Treponema sp.]MBQ5384084.1 hypothetical protein [Treponema sp.]